MFSFQAFTANVQTAFKLAAQGNVASETDARDRLQTVQDAAVAKAMAVLEERALRQPDRPRQAEADSRQQAPVQLSNTGKARSAAPAAATELPASVQQFEPADFQRLKQVSTMRSVESSMQFSLTTADGDTVTVDLKQFDYEARTRLKGLTDDGARFKGRASESESSRALSISVDGDLDADERAAVDALMRDVVDVAQSFFAGKDKAALGKAMDLQLDSSELTGFALDLNQTETRVRETVKYRQQAAEDSAPALTDLARRDPDVREMLLQLADGAKDLVEKAADLLTPISAAKIGREFLPVIIQPVDRVKPDDD